jgi:hypothetical protein
VTVCQSINNKISRAVKHMLLYNLKSTQQDARSTSSYRLSATSITRTAARCLLCERAFRQTSTTILLLSQAETWSTSTPKMGTTCFSKPPVSFYHSTLRQPQKTANLVSASQIWHLQEFTAANTA